MQGGTISGSVTISVDLGGAAYASPLTVGSSGVILPSLSSAAGVLAVVADAALTNDGKIRGGVGLAAEGGVGVNLLSGGDTLSNLGSIAGGTGRSTGKAGLGLNGGIGVTIASGEITNAGTITGGQGGGFYNPIPAPSVGNGGTGVALHSSSLVNNGSISGGNAGSVGYLSGLDQFYLYYGAGGTGVSLADASSSVLNRGTITGGSYGGVGIDMLAGGSLLNRGTIAGGFSGGDAVVARNGLIANTGVVQAGGGGGRSGIELEGGKLLNSGTIKGGAGASGYYGGSPGGGGVNVKGGGVLFNSGTIIGGAGGFAQEEQVGFAGGSGVSLDGGTMVDSGLIVGGSSGDFRNRGLSGSAVHFGTEASTLIIEPTASFFGRVLADSTADDTLILAGTGGMLSGIGKEFVDFTTIAEEQAANWSLAGTNTIAAATTLIAGGVLGASGKLVDDGSIIVAKGGALTLGGTVTGSGAIQIDAGTSLIVNSTLDIPSLVFGPGRHGTLSLGEGVTVGGAISGFSIGDTIQLALHATSLTYAAGTLTLDNGYKGVDKLAFDGSYSATDFHLTHGGSVADPTTDITYVGTSASGPAMLPDFASAVPQNAAAEAPATETRAATLLDRIGWPDKHLFIPGHDVRS